MKRTVKRIAAVLGLLLLLLVAVLVIRTLMFTSVQIQVPPSTVEVDGKAVSERLATAVRFRTISGERTEGPAPFEAMHAWMAETYPDLHRVAQREVLFGLNLLYTWKGSDPSLKPVALLAHQDVVPIEPGTDGDWTHPPWEGRIAPCGDEPGDCIWGRGTIDMKAALIGILEAAQMLAASGWQPKRTIYFAFGADEEVGGAGAAAMAKRFAEQGVQLEWVLDEGLLITDGLMPGLDTPVALIGIAEKGYTTLELVAKGAGGHSSMPPATTAAGRIARAVARLEADPFPRAIDGAVAEMFDRVGPEMPFGTRLAFANRWLLEPILIGQLSKGPSTNALLHTTQAATMLSASVQDNILPQEAIATVNYRVHPRDTIDSVRQRVIEVIDDPEIEVRRRQSSRQQDPAPIASATSTGYALIEAGIRASFPEAVVSSGMFIAISDSYYYVPVADDVYRFHPIRLTPTDGKRIHGTNERLRVADVPGLVRFYHHVLSAAGQ